jgi:hypothetical protein
MEVKGSVDEARKQLSACFAEALKSYHQQNWSDACEKFKKSLKPGLKMVHLNPI